VVVDDAVSSRRVGLLPAVVVVSAWFLSVILVREIAGWPSMLLMRRTRSAAELVDRRVRFGSRPSTMVRLAWCEVTNMSFAGVATDGEAGMPGDSG